MKNIDLPRTVLAFFTCLAICTLLSLRGPLATTSSLTGALAGGTVVAIIVTAALVTLGRFDRDRVARH